MKKPLYTLSLLATLSVSSVYAVEYGINGNDAGTKNEIGNEFFTDATLWSRQDRAEVPVEQRVLPNFETDQLKFDNVHVTISSGDTNKFHHITGMWDSSLTVTGEGTVLTAIDNIWQDGNSHFKVLDGAKFVAGGDIGSLSSIEVKGSATAKSTIEGAFANITNGNVTFDNAVWNNARRGTNVGWGQTLSLNKTDWTQTAGGIDIEANYKTNDDGTITPFNSIIEIKSDNVLNISGNLRVGSGNSEYGTATFHVTGDNNVMNFGNMETATYGRTGGVAIAKVEGKNNTFNVTGNINIDGYVPNGTVEGGTVGFEFLGEGNTFTSNNRIHIGRNDGGVFHGGYGYMKFAGTNAENKNVLNLNSDFNLGLGDNVYDADGYLEKESTYVSELIFGGNTVVLNYDGSDAMGSINVGTGGPGGVGATGGTAKMIVNGSGNEINVYNLNVMQNTSATGGATGIVDISGSNNVIQVKNWLAIIEQNGTQGGKAIVTFGGENNKLITENVSLANHDDSAGGDGVFTITGKGNTFEAGSFKMGAGTNIESGVGKLVIEGSGNTIKINTDFNSWTPDIATIDEPIGAVIEFVFDQSGISTIEVGGNANIGGTFFNIDLSALVGNYDEKTNGYWHLISMSNDAQVNLDKVQIFLRDNDEEGAARLETVLQDDGRYALTLFYNSTAYVPEPSTYAAIFGAIALAFVAYRRKKRA